MLRHARRYYVYGIIATPTPVTFDVAGVDDRGGKVCTICERGLGIVVSATTRPDYRRMERQEALCYLAAHQGVIEAVMERFPVLPVKFGTVLPSRRRVRRLLEQGAALFHSTLERLAGRVQVEVVVTWDLLAIFREIAAEEPIGRAKAQALSAPPEDAAAARVAVGQLVKASLDRRRAELQRRLLPCLRDGAADLVVNPLLDEGIVLNVALLLDGAGRARLDRQVAALDQELQGRLNFRCVGPLPPYSFAAVAVEVPSFADVCAARRLLGLPERATLGEIKQAYRRLSAQHHPDVNADDHAAALMVELGAAYRLLTTYGQSQAWERGAETVCAFDRQAAAGTLLISLMRQEALNVDVPGAYSGIMAAPSPVGP